MVGGEEASTPPPSLSNPPTLQSPVSTSKSGFTLRSGHWEINLSGCAQSVTVLTAGGAGDDNIISGGSEGHTQEMRKSSCTQLRIWCV